MTSLSASSNLGPWQDSHDGGERLCRTSFEPHTPLVLEIPAEHSQDLPWETEVRLPCPDHRKADSLECLRKVQHQGHSPSILCFCSSIKSLNFHQFFPHCALGSSISTIRGVHTRCFVQVAFFYLGNASSHSFNS